VGGVNVTIDGTKLSVESGTTILEAARGAGIYIPALCAHPNLPLSSHLKPFEVVYRGKEEVKNDSSLQEIEGCQLCLVAIEGMEDFSTACNTEVSEDMVVHTNIPKIQQRRKERLQAILADHPNVCLACDRKEDCDPYRGSIRKASVVTGCEFCPSNGRCELQEVAAYIAVDGPPPVYEYKGPAPIKSDPFFERSYHLCIACTRCVRACQEIWRNSAIGLVFQKGKIVIGSKAPTLKESGCQFCGACLDVCPTGALTEWANKWEGVAQEHIRTTCPYCGVGCQMWLHVNKNGRISSVTAVEDAAPNKGRLCVKGRFAYDFIYSKDRLTSPLVKENGGFREASWDEALDLVADRFENIIENHGPDAVAGVSCARSLNEDSYQMQKLFRAVFKTNNIDHCART
jgi:predicted molibdopterin-dependent oxidoreductase YjgC